MMKVMLVCIYKGMFLHSLLFLGGVARVPRKVAKGPSRKAQKEWERTRLPVGRVTWIGLIFADRRCWSPVASRWQADQQLPDTGGAYGALWKVCGCLAINRKLLRSWSSVSLSADVLC
jgi:hypothetical protein